MSPSNLAPAPNTIARLSPGYPPASSVAAAFQLKPLAYALGLLLLTGTAQAADPRPFSNNWFSVKGATRSSTAQARNGSMQTGMAPPLAQQQQANQQLQRSINNLGHSAALIAAQQVMQQASRQAALDAGSTVPDGLADGGLKVDDQPASRGWINAKALTKDTGQTVADGRTVVTINQIQDKAILNWETFNLSKNTRVDFQQQSNWAVLNRVNDPQGRPSQIQGQIAGQGTVMLVNRNGIVFNGASQTNVRNLVAAAVEMTDKQFNKGLYSDALGAAFVPTFANNLVAGASGFSHDQATGTVVVESGARIETGKPQSVSEGGGYVLLVGKEAYNRGSIVTPSGQTMLAAGDAFVIRKGAGTDANQDSSTRGNEVNVLRSVGSQAGRVVNSGLIQAVTGDITLAGSQVDQQGVLLATTSVNTRGTLHLRAAGDSAGQVRLAPGSLSAILLDDSPTTALDIQRDSLLKDSDNLSGNAYNRRDQSLVEIASSGDIVFNRDSLTLATGGQVNATAGGQSRLEQGAAIDVSGAVGVSLAMASNNVLVNIQGNELRDAFINRDGKSLNNSEVWVDRRDLVLVPAGTNGYDTDRWYTAGGLLEVSGYLNTNGHGIGEWAAQGGTVSFGGGSVLTQAGSNINISGGSLNIQTGKISLSWLKGVDGRLYNVSTAPGDNLYTGLYRGFEDAHVRWGGNTTEYYYSPLIAPRERLENGYTVGRDAGRIIVATGSAELAGDIDTTVFQGDRQSRARDSGLDGYRQAQTAVARAGQLIIGRVTPVYDTKTGQLRDSMTAVVGQVNIGLTLATTGGQDATASAQGDPLLPAAVELNADWLNGLGLGGLSVYATGGIAVTSALTVSNGGNLDLHATQVDVSAPLTARAGTIALGNIINSYISAAGGSWMDIPVAAIPASGYQPVVRVGNDVKLDARGLWSNQVMAPDDNRALPYINGGTIRLASTGDISLGDRSLVDVSSGAALLASGKQQGGRGGNITLQSNQNDQTGTGAGTLKMNGELRGYGVNGSGTLTIDSGIGIALGGGLLADSGVLPAGQSVPIHLTLAEAFTIPAGTVFDNDFIYTSNVVKPGQVTSGNPNFSPAHPIVLKAGWIVPPAAANNFAVYNDNGQFFSAGSYVPAGTVLVNISGDMAPGYTVPGDAFPDGIPVADYNVTLRAGQPLPASQVLAAGSQLPAGTRLPGAVAVKPLLVLDDAILRSGFSRYAISSQQGVQVAQGARLDVLMPALRFMPNESSSLATGDDPDRALQRWLPPLWQEDPIKGVLTRRGGADLSLNAGSAYLRAPINIGAGAQVTVDPGRTISLVGNGQVTVDGELNAWGGKISILPGTLGTGNNINLPDGSPNTQSIWLGGAAVLDVAGRAVTAVDAGGRLYGQVDKGGTIEIGGVYNQDATQVDAADAFLVVRPGARLDASGTQARVNQPTVGPTEVASDGGVIALSSYRGLFIDGSLRAASGGQGAAGGTLALNLDTPNYGMVDRNTLKGPLVDDAVRTPRELVLAQEQGDSGLAAGLRAGEHDQALVYGRARVGADRIAAGGFDNLSLLSNGLVSFAGDLTLALRQSLRLTASAMGLSVGSTASRVSLSAPYVLLAGSGRGQTDDHIMPNPVRGSKNVGDGGGVLGVPLVGVGSSLLIDAQLLDIAATVGFGARGTIIQNAVNPLVVKRDAFEQTTLRSAGDMRMYRAAKLYTPGNLTLAAAQIYPGLNDSGTLVVGQRNYTDQWGTLLRQFDPARSLTIERSNPANVALPAMPYSLFGKLYLSAATVNQNGVLRAPLGEINVGSSGYGTETGQVNLLPGSVTSVSARGLTMPYGGSLDGLSYLYNGADVVFKGVGNDPFINLSGHAIDVQPGAILDLSGGGVLTGAAFLAGRGGSTDARLYPLVQTAAGGGFSLPSLATNPVYAIVPGVQAGYAPIVAEKGAGDPAIGRQITLAKGIPGLPAGTYTLLPSSFALLPGAFRVELNGLVPTTAPGMNPILMRNGSYAAAARLSVANTGIVNTTPSQIVITPADMLRRYSQYNETSYADFALAQATRDGIPRALLERDAKTLSFTFLTKTQPGVLNDAPALRFAGTTWYSPAADGFGGSAVMRGGYGVNYEILPDGAPATAGFDGISLNMGDVNAIGAARLGIGGLPSVTYAQSNTGNTQLANIATFGTAAENIVLREGAVLKASEIFLITNTKAGGIVIEQGAGINTLGQGKAAWDSTNGYVYNPGINSVLAVSNGWLDMLAPGYSSDYTNGAGSIDIGACRVATGCHGITQLYSEGSIAAATDQRFDLRDTARYGTRNLVLAVGGINVGSAASLAAVAERHALPAGLTLNQEILDRLLNGDTSVGAPALENLVLTARDAMNFYDSVELSTIDPRTGKSALSRLVLGSPAIYGFGGPDALARINTDILVWNGAVTAPGLVAAGGAGTGSGRLQIDTRQIEFGYGPNSRPDTIHSQDRLILGFSQSVLNASERITANQAGALKVYQSQGAWDDKLNGYTYSGGNLTLNTPLLTGQAGSVNRITAGGDIQVSTPTGSSSAAISNQTLADALGAEIALDGRSLTLDSAVLLPSGKITLSAEGDVVLDSRARLDLAGRKIDFFDTSKYSWGGDVVLNSRAGDIRQSADSRIDISAQNNRAGTLTAVALGAGAGRVDLAGAINGASSGYYDAGGTLVPFAGASTDLRGQQISDFIGLNQRLNAGQVFGGRSFQLKQGDLTIGDDIKAREVVISLDGGHLMVAGTIDAGGEQVGSIRLSARDGVTLGGNSVLDAHGSVLRVDSYGKAIDAPNRAVIDINAGGGRLTLLDGARMDLRSGGDGQAFGTVELSAPRLGGARGNDIDIDARGKTQINGARAITVNGFWSYQDADPGTADPTSDGRPYQIINQAYLDEKHADSLQFINHALANGDLMNNRLAGLRAYGDQFHLRPGVAIVSATPDGDLHLDGDIDLSGYRYASVNPHTTQTATYGSGESGALVLRAGGNLNIYGSLTDGFDGSVLPVTLDDQGWVLVKGKIPWGGDVVVPHGGLVTLSAGTVFQSGRTLNYDLPIAGLTLPAGTRLATRATLTGDLTLPAGTVLGGAVLDNLGQVVYAAGTVLAQPVALTSGMQLDAGSRLPVLATVGALRWPAGVALPANVTLAQALTLAKGALIPSETDVKLPDDAVMVNLRLADSVGNQGRNWALAPMLAAGSQSWSLRLVSGADTQAADSRALRPDGHNLKLLLNDTHYGLVKTNVLVPGTGLPGEYVWAGDSLNQAGEEPGTPIDLAVWGGEAAVLDFNNLGFGILVVKVKDGTPPEYTAVMSPARQQLFSVLRTGTGDLDLVAGGNIDVSSPYGIYTAGTQSAGADGGYNLPRAYGYDGTLLGQSGKDFEPLINGGAQSLYRAWYPEQGGNVLVRAQGDVTGDLIGARFSRRNDALGFMRQHVDTSAVGNWLWRQGTGSAVAGGDGVPTAWWINFGSYVAGPADGYDLFSDTPFLVGFTGIGTLGGGNLVLEAGGNAGMLTSRMDTQGSYLARSQGLNLVVGSTGRVSSDGRQLTLTGGGDLDIRLGGGLNPVAEVRSFPDNTPVTPNTRYAGNRSDLNSTFVNLRGALRLEAGSVGGIELRYDRHDAEESRAYDVYTASSSIAGGGPVLMPGDSGVRIDARGDLVIGGIGDPGRVMQLDNGTPFTANGVKQDGEGWSWFSLWTPATAVDLFSAGGNLTPSTAWTDSRDRTNASPTDGQFVIPSILRAVAASGSLYYGNAALGSVDGSNQPVQSPLGLLLAPSPVGSQYTHTGAGQLELLAAGSIYASGYSITQSGADPTALPSPFNPGFSGSIGSTWFGQLKLSNISADALAASVFLEANVGADSAQRFPLFSFTPPTASANAVEGPQPGRFYALTGDIIGLRTGSIIYRGNSLGQPGNYDTWYIGGGPVAIHAGRDIVNSGTTLGEVENPDNQFLGWLTQPNRADANAPQMPIAFETGDSARGNLIVHNRADDISTVTAGRDIRYSSFYVAGPGLLEVTAGRDLYMADRAELKSIGPVVNVTSGDRSSGAGIAVAAGVGANGLNFDAFAQRYLDPANLADPGRPLADQPGKVVRVYDDALTLAGWLKSQFGYTGDEQGANAFLTDKQAELDHQQQLALAAGSSTPRRDLQREYDLDGQLHLVNWLSTRFGGANGSGRHFDAVSMDARQFFATLAPEQQRAYLRNVYFAELKAAGREYNAVNGPRQGSYLRGREAIATLFPIDDASGHKNLYQGDLTMFSSANYYADPTYSTATKRPLPGVKYLRRDEHNAAGAPYNIGVYDVLDAGIHTDFGGDISIMTPGGRTLVGVDGGFVPGEGSGVLTQGSGEVQIYARDSILLGQSRIFTTFGGNILAWSAEGDINAGRGSKSTVVFTPQRRVYDDIGLVTLSPNTPNTGAGIATLNPIPEVPPGDIDLIAPLGTIDAGEAGIRVSGNVNIAALRVVNAENIQVQGQSTGIPTVAAVNVGALTSASQAAGGAVQAAEQVSRQSQRNRPSVISVEILGYGSERLEAGGGQPATTAAIGYNPDSAVQVLAAGPLSQASNERLSAEERRKLSL